MKKNNTKVNGKAITRKNRRTAYAFLLPNFIGFLVFTLIPVIFSLILSFTDWDGSNPIEFVGLKNFKRMLKDSGFIISFWNTIYYTLCTVPLTIILALVLAVILNKGLRGIKFFRAVHFFPHIASVVAIAVVWQFLYNPEMGPINSVLRAIGISNPPRWTSSAKWAMPAVIIMSVWKSAGYYMVMFLAGLQGIPSHLYEAAKIDGANWWERFKHVTLPMLSPTTFFVTIMCIINSFKVFDQIYMMTEGGPGRATSVLVYYIYNQAFVNFKFGYASAIALVFFALILFVTIIQYKNQEKWVNYMN